MKNNEKGTYIGIGQDEHEPIIITQFHPGQGAGGICIGKPGKGKNFRVKDEII